MTTYDFRKLVLQGNKNYMGLALGIYRFLCITWTLLLVVLMLLAPPKDSGEWTAFYLIWLGNVLLLSAILLCVLFDWGTKSQGAVFRIANNGIEVDHYKTNGKKSKTRIYQWNRLKFIDTGIRTMTVRGGVNGTSSAISASAKTVRIGFQPIKGSRMTIPLQLRYKGLKRKGGKLIELELMEAMMLEANQKIAITRGISPEEIEKERIKYVKEAFPELETV